MANNYDFMFKFIIIGDSSNLPSIKVLERAAYFLDSLREDSKLIMNPHWELNSAPGLSTLTASASKYKSGTR